MEYFERLGQTLLEQWTALDFRESDFSRLAYEALCSQPVHKVCDPLDPMRWLMREARSLPVQQDLESSFGQPPLVMYANSRFYIQVLYWLEATTAIHQHGFSGAFQVLGGSSLHSQFSFEEQGRFNSRLLKGELKHRKSELLGVGATRPIRSGPGFIHSLFHLDHPSVTVVVRTTADGHAGPQYSYWWPGVAVDPFFTDPLTTRHRQAVKMLCNLKHPDLESMVGTLLERIDLSGAVAVLLELLRHLHDPDLLDPYLDRLRKRYGNEVDLLARSLAHLARSDRLVQARKAITDPDHRFFLALLLNLEGQTPILALTRDRFPNEDPRVLILKWMAELCGPRESGGPNPFGLVLDEPMLLIARCLLKGLNHEQLIARFAMRYSSRALASQSAMLERACEAFRASPFFSPLFRA